MVFVTPDAPEAQLNQRFAGHIDVRREHDWLIDHVLGLATARRVRDEQLPPVAVAAMAARRFVLSVTPVASPDASAAMLTGMPFATDDGRLLCVMSNDPPVRPIRDQRHCLIRRPGRLRPQRQRRRTIDRLRAHRRERHWHDRGSMTLGGRRVEVSRPRMRTADDEHELPVRSYPYFADRDLLTRAVMDLTGPRSWVHPL